MHSSSDHSTNTLRKVFKHHYIMSVERQSGRLLQSVSPSSKHRRSMTPPTKQMNHYWVTIQVSWWSLFYQYRVNFIQKPVWTLGFCVISRFLCMQLCRYASDLTCSTSAHVTSFRHSFIHSCQKHWLKQPRTERPAFCPSNHRDSEGMLVMLHHEIFNCLDRMVTFCAIWW